MSNKSVVISKFGQPTDVVKVVETVRPSVGPDQVLVNVKLRPINPADCLSIMGAYPGYKPQSHPSTPGLEGYGVVAEVGANVTDVKIGQRVVPFFNAYEGIGSWQEYVVVGKHDFVNVPDNVSDESAAQLIVNPVTVICMLDQLNIPKGEYLLQSAAGSTLGRQTIQLAKHRGIKTVNLVRRTAQIEELKAIGADIVVSTDGLTTSAEIAAAIAHSMGGKKPYAAIDCVGAEVTSAITMSIRDSATVLVYGVLKGVEGAVFVPSLIFRDITVKGFWLGSTLMKMSSAQRQAACSEAMDLMSKGIVAPHSGEIFPMDQVLQAIAKSNEMARNGKVLLSS
ncbi:hypothetical protein QVD99_008436 [Batrachochytrium dendrobatidis]|nr:hypothetical protein O5D80_007308 [Batrachochytrium dendrobatidis]KAK5664898.1 hypothetical protein QVD99_008436 [Batrachochytrium dendrobatidis]